MAQKAALSTVCKTVDTLSAMAEDIKPFVGPFCVVFKLIQQIKATSPLVHKKRVGRLKARLLVLEEQLRSMQISGEEPAHLQRSCKALEEVLKEALTETENLGNKNWIQRIISKGSVDSKFEDLNQRLCEHTQALMLSLNIDSHAMTQTFNKDTMRSEDDTDRATDLKDLEVMKETLMSVKDNTEEIKTLVKEMSNKMESMKSSGSTQPDSPPLPYPPLSPPIPFLPPIGFTPQPEMASPVAIQPLQMASPVATQPLQMASPVATHPLQMASPVVTQPLQMVSPVATHPLQMASPVATQPLQMASPVAVSPVSSSPIVVVNQPSLMSSPVVITESPQTQAVRDNVAIAKGKLGGKPAITTCKNCRQRVESKVIYQRGCYAWSMCTLIFCFGMVCGCCLIPLYSKKCKDAHHSCPQCNAKLSVYKRCC